jgi:hypothetical protein
VYSIFGEYTDRQTDRMVHLIMKYEIYRQTDRMVHLIKKYETCGNRNEGQPLR